MQCQFKTVTGFGRYDVESFSVDVTSQQSAAAEVKQYLKDNGLKCLGFFITALFETDPRSKKVKVLYSIKDADIDNATRDVQEMYRRRKNWLIRKRKKA